MTSGRDTVLHLAGPVRLGDDDVRRQVYAAHHAALGGALGFVEAKVIRTT